MEKIRRRISLFSRESYASRLKNNSSLDVVYKTIAYSSFLCKEITKEIKDLNEREGII